MAAGDTTKQVPPAHNHEFVAGNPYSFTVASVGATITSPAVTLKTGGGDVITADPGVPDVSQAGAATTVAFDVAASAALNTTVRDKTYIYSLQAMVDGDGPHELVARQIIVHPVGTAITSQSADPVNLTVTIGGADIALEVTIGALVGNLDGGAPDSVYGGTTGVDGGTV